MTKQSRSARKRRQRAAVLAKQMHYGDPEAAFRLAQRGRALKGIAKGGWHYRLALANAARLKKRQERLAAAAIAAERRRLEAQCTVNSPAMMAALRAVFGTGGVRGDYAEGECRPVAGGKCPACGWKWGGREPHISPVARELVAKLLGTPTDTASLEKAMATASIRPDREFREEDRSTAPWHYIDICLQD